MIDTRRLRALLVHCIGVEGQPIFKKLGADDLYGNKRDNLADHFGLHVNGHSRSIPFPSVCPRPGEPVRDYVSILRQLAATCRFGGLYSEYIRDQLVTCTALSKVCEQHFLKVDTISCSVPVQITTQIEVR